VLPLPRETVNKQSSAAMSAASIAAAADSHTNNRDVDPAPFLTSSSESNINGYSSFQKGHGDIDPESLDYSRTTASNATGTMRPMESQSPLDANVLLKAECASNANADKPEQAAAAWNIPEDVLQILTEVARKGASSVLPWRSEVKPLTEHSMRDRPFAPEALSSHAKQEHYRSNDRNKSHSHKRARAAMSSRNGRSMSDRQTFHRSYFSSGGRSTTTSTMVVEPSTSLATSTKNKGYPMNGSHPVGGTTSNLFLIRTTQSSSAPSPSLGSLFSPGSAGSGRTSGSEHEDTSQYECDSEGTSATSNSEMSFSTNSFTKGGFVRSSNEGNRVYGVVKRQPKYSSLKDALTFSLNSVLDFYYQNRGGYKLSPAEKRKYSLAGMVGAHLTNQEKHSSNHPPEWTADEIFQNRKKHILDMLGRYCDTNMEQRGTTMSPATVGDMLPPFTVQRIAEVLMEPERYYTQTHKLCNCMEKLLLVTSSTSAFGAMIGKETSPMHREEAESTAVSDEKSRLRSEFRQSHRRTRRKTDSIFLADKAEMRRGLLKEEKGMNEPLVLSSPNDKTNNEEIRLPPDDVDESQERISVSAKEAAARDALEAAARATLRTKFDHVGIDPHSSAALANSRDVLALIESRRLTNSPPPPATSGLRPHGHRSPPSPPSPELLRRMSSPRVPSPVLFSSFGERLSPSPPPMAPLLAHPNALSFAHPNALSFAGARNTFASGGLGSPLGRDTDLGSRSPTSSEDLDSTESDFDDSASDRSDSSDSEARVLARNRMQQRLQGRVRAAVPAARAEDSGESDASDPAD
jgi:PPP4R2